MDACAAQSAEPPMHPRGQAKCNRAADSTIAAGHNSDTATQVNT
jgi:hypothetical protein